MHSQIERFTQEPVFTIAAGATASNAVATSGFSFGSIQLPAAMTGATITFQVSNDGTTWADVTEIIAGTITDLSDITFSASDWCEIYTQCFNAKYMRIVSAGAEAAARTIQGYFKG